MVCPAPRHTALPMRGLPVSHLRKLSARSSGLCSTSAPSFHLNSPGCPQGPVPSCSARRTREGGRPSPGSWVLRRKASGGPCRPVLPGAARGARAAEREPTATPRAALSQARWVCVGRGPVCAGKVLGLILSNTRAPAMLSQLCPPVVCLRPRGVCPLSSQPSAGEGVEGRFSEEAQGPPSTCTVTHTPHPERPVF